MLPVLIYITSDCQTCVPFYVADMSEMCKFTCVRGLIGINVAIDTPPPGLIITRLLGLTPSVHYSQQTKKRESLISPCRCRAAA